jgi:hypothetical protein
MAETLNFTFGWELDGKPEVRRKTETVAISLATGEPHYAEHTIADATSAGVFGEDVIWSAGDGGKDTFEVCMLLCNVAMWYEFKDDAGSPVRRIRLRRDQLHAAGRQGPTPGDNQSSSSHGVTHGNIRLRAAQDRA